MLLFFITGKNVDKFLIDERLSYLRLSHYRVSLYNKCEQDEIDIVTLKVGIRILDTYVCYIYISDKTFRDRYKKKY